MPPQEEHDKPENLVEAPHQAEHTARSLQEAADSNATLQGYYSINDLEAPKEVEEQIDQKPPKDQSGR
ncbi:MAG: hypothetical protein JO097_10080 [Acidobacteriaceae bacterium]|nr:hypothetical protein [Acidobacteriaceae bacterium]MBV9297140.1 hypothetical protein [Acidobacteriaceae bacterium]MBV9767780.1 hypothetical protein [Acidobacteriaceae bacterium]